MWLVQYAGVPADNCDQVLEILKAKNIPFTPVGIRPFTTEIMGLEGADLTGATMEVEYRLYDRRWVPAPHICTQCRIACEWRGINVYLVEAL